MALVDDNRDVLGAALIANGFDRNDSDQAALDKAASWLEGARSRAGERRIIRPSP